MFLPCVKTAKLLVNDVTGKVGTGTEFVFAVATDVTILTIRIHFVFSRKNKIPNQGS
jgi:hypothetical protein